MEFTRSSAHASDTSKRCVTSSIEEPEEVEEGCRDLVGCVPFEEMAGSDNDLRATPCRRVGDRVDLVEVAPQCETRCGDAMQSLCCASIAERPQDVGRSDIAEVAGNRCLFRAEVREAVGKG